MNLGAISKLEEAEFRDANNCRTCNDRTPTTKVLRCKSCTEDIGEDVLICAMCAILQHKEHDVAKLASWDEIRDARATNDNNDKYVHDAKPALVDSFKSIEHDLQEAYDKICVDYQAVFTSLDSNINAESSRPDRSTLETTLSKSNQLVEHFKA
ncbi:hypothetical protein AAVH_42501, partial [Aphelenchoides avenae]